MHMGDAAGEAAGGDPAREVEKLEPCASSAATRWALGATLTSLLGCAVLLSVSVVPTGVVVMWLPTMGGIVGLLGMYTCFSRGCSWSWSWSWKGCWDSCGELDHGDDPFHTVKMFCCAVSLTGPVVIMGGSVVMLWCLELYVAAVALGASSMGLVVVVAAMDLLAVVRCARCLGELCRRNGKSSVGRDVKAFVVSAMNADVGQLFLGVAICMAVNLGVTVAIWVALGSLPSLWESGLGYVPVGLAIFLVPVISLCLVLNCLMISACAGSLWRCKRCCWEPNREDDWKNTMYSPDSDGESWTMESGVIQTIPPERVSMV